MDDAEALIAAAGLAAPRDVASAAHLLARALDCMTSEDERRDELVLQLLPMAIWAGRPRHAESLARDEMTRDRTAVDATRIRIHLAQALGMQDRWAEACDVWEHVMQTGEFEGTLARRANAEYASALAFGRQIPAARRRVEATNVESERDQLTRFLTLQALATCLFLEGQSSGAAELTTEMVRICEKTDDLEIRWRNPYLMHGLILSVSGALEPAIEALETARQLAHATGALWAAPAYQWFLGNILYRQGRWDQAVAECQEGLRICATGEPTWERASLLGNYAVIEARRGAFQRAESLIERFDEIVELNLGDRGWRALAAALVLEGRGDPETGLAELVSIWDEAKRLGVFQSIIGVAPDFVRLVRAVGDQARAERLLSDLRALESELPSARGLAVTAAYCRGVLRRDPRELEWVIDAYADVTHEVHVALAHEELAVLYAERKRPRKAMVALREALQRLDRMGAYADARRARGRLRALGVIGPPPLGEPTGEGAWSQLTSTERAVAELVAEGLRNQEIAARLFVSIQTVQTHLKNIFRKLGATSRSQVVREALRQAESSEGIYGAR